MFRLLTGRTRVWTVALAVSLLVSSCEEGFFEDVDEGQLEESVEVGPAVGTGGTFDLPGDDGIYNPYGVSVDPLYEVNSATISADAEARLEESHVIADEGFFRVDGRPDKVDESDPQPVPKISPVLLEWLAARDPSDVVEIIITFQEDLRIPLLPELEDGADRAGRDTARAAAIAELKELRDRSQEAALGRLGEFGIFEPAEGFWIVNAIAGSAPLREIERLAESSDVVYLQPVEGGEEPPQDANANNDAEDGRALIVSDPYANLGLRTPWIGLLDTGVRDSHQMFNSPRNIDWMRDCVNGGTDCDDTSDAAFDATDFAWNHGTSSAGLLVGNDRLGAAYQGVTNIGTDSWQIYTTAGLETTAAVRAIQAAVAAYDKVLVGEIQANAAATDAIATAADNAYDAGVIFVAANGNFGPNAGSVRSPANAHKVLGIGGFDTDGGAQYGNQGRGPAADGRWKPDVQAPTWSETASNASDTALTVFTGTSGSTPYAAAAAMLVRNWLAQLGTFDNGQVYAFMILYGQNEWPYDNTTGAGPIEMATDGQAWWGKLAVTDGLTIDIPIDVGPGRQDFDVALWWPESAAQHHNDIDIHLIDPGGVERAKGYSSVSVFERTGVSGALQEGQWVIRIHGFNVQTSPQTVYWAAHVRN